MTSHQNHMLLPLALLLGATLPLGCNNRVDSSNAEASGARPAESHPLDENGQMQAGLEALYMRHDPAAAATAFRKVLELNPTHYGATYQLATALDQMRKPAEAEPLWQKVLAMANGYQDTATADVARARLGQSQAPDVQMQVGLDALYTRRDAPAAVAAFRKVLELNPTHYGATYQLAAALDAAGKPDEARPLWERMLQMAEAAHDQQTTDTVRTRLTTP